MPFSDNPHPPFSPAATNWVNTNKILKPAPPVLTDDILFDLVISAANTHNVGPTNPTNPASANSPQNAAWLASPANPKNSSHAAWIAARPTKKDK
jgi:hypothetical protein